MTSYKAKNIKPEVSLLPHQEDATKATLSHNGNIIFAHDTGTGKTLSFINAFEKLRDEGKASRALVVLPAALRSNFVKNGLERFTVSPNYAILGTQQELISPSKNVVDVDNYKNPADYNIVSYDLFKKDPKKYIDNIKPDTIIYDEIHRAKNEDTKLTQVLKDTRPYYKNFIAGTGSVVSNTPADVVPLIDVMTGGNHRLGTKTLFEKRFLSEDKDGIKRIVNRSAAKAQLGKYVHYIGKDDLVNFAPPKVEEEFITVPMSQRQDEVYRYIYDKLDPITKAKLKMKVGNISDKEFKTMFNKLMSARQAANSPHTFSNLDSYSLDDGYNDSPKVKKAINDVIDHLTNTPDAKVIMGSQFINGGIDLLEHGLAKNNIPYSKFIGKGNKGITDKVRQQSVNDFQSGKSKVLLISSAGGEGLDFPDTTMISMLDGHFNPEVISQMKARGVRAGGQQNRKPEDRKVLVKYYKSEPLYSKAEVAKNLLQDINPSTYVNRFLDGEPLFRNPVSRPPGIDNIIYQIAARKSKANKEVKDLLKTSGFNLRERYIDFNKHMQDYTNQYNTEIANDINPDSFIFFNKNDELQRANALRKDISVALAASKDPFGYKRISKKEKENKFNSDNIESPWSYFKSKLLPYMAFANIVGIGTHQFENSPRTLKTIALLTGAGALAGAGFSRSQFSGDLQKKQLSKLNRFTDEELINILRGNVIQKQKIKKEDYFL